MFDSPSRMRRDRRSRQCTAEHRPGFAPYNVPSNICFYFVDYWAGSWAGNGVSRDRSDRSCRQRRNGATLRADFKQATKHGNDGMRQTRPYAREKRPWIIIEQAFYWH
jgi:hypothetical protein